MGRSGRSSLAWRIFWVCLCLILIPLSLFSLFLWEKEVRTETLSALQQLEEVTAGTLERIEVEIAQTKALLTLAADYYEATGVIPPLPVPFYTDSTQRGKPLTLFIEVGAKMYGTEFKVEELLPRDIAPFTFSLESEPKASEGTLLFSLDDLQIKKEKIGFFESLHFSGKRLSTYRVMDELKRTLVVTGETSSLASGRRVLSSTLLFLSLLTVVGVLISVWLIHQMGRPLGALATEMGKVASGDLAVRYKSAPFGFEINTLGSHFNQMLSDLKASIERGERDMVIRVRLEEELMIGQQIQRALFPKELPIESGLTIGTGFLPAREVGGDFYDIAHLESGEVLIVIADGSDKGISACLYSLITRSLIRGLVESKQTLAQGIQRVNAHFCSDTGDTGNFVTAWIGVYSPNNRVLTYANLGHPSPILIGEEVAQLEGRGIALGASPVLAIELHERQLPPRSLLLLYTDGIIEAENETGELFGKSRLMRLLDPKRREDPQGIVDLILGEVSHFVGKAPQTDDLTLLSVTIQ